jgi:hypothetical protein
MAKKNTELTAIESFFYILVCILSCGGLWLSKIVIKKAINESNLIK